MASQQNAEVTAREIFDKVSGAFDSLANTISSHAPEAWILVVKGNYATAVGQLIISGIVLSLMLLFAYMCRYFVLRVAEIDKLIQLAPNISYDAKEFINSFGKTYIICAVISGGLAAICTIIFLVNAMDAHMWAMIVAPDAVTARDVLLRAIN